MTDTSVEDAVTKLVDAAGQLTAMPLTGAEKRARDRTLAKVRASEDALLQLQAGLSTHRNAALGGSSILAGLARQLQSISTSLESK